MRSVEKLTRGQAQTLPTGFDRFLYCSNSVHFQEFCRRVASHLPVIHFCVRLQAFRENIWLLYGCFIRIGLDRNAKVGKSTKAHGFKNIESRKTIENTD
jgi:hypothetical protein